MDEEVVHAIRVLLNVYHLEDMIYDVRENLELPSDFEGSTWEHPKVVRFGELVQVLKAAVEPTPEEPR